MRIALLCLIAVHGILHLLGFLKAFQPARVLQLTHDIPRMAGILWLLAALLFLLSCCLLLLNHDSWWIPAGIGLLLSQYLILRSWSDAKFGTIPNLIILLPVIIAIASALPSSYQSRYRAEVQRRLGAVHDTTLVSEQDVRHLPPPVQKYLSYVGAIGKPRVHNFRAVFKGTMKRAIDAGWMEISAQQYDFFDDPARLFYIRSAVVGIPFEGLHAYVGDSATMQIKVASLVQVVDAKGEQMTRGETVTLFNDLCVLAPAALIDSAIEWEPVDSLRAKATYYNKGYTISAELTFDEQGALTNFISNDRFLSSDGKTYLRYPWSTPVRDYREFDGRKVPSNAEAVWHRPEGDYVYAKYDLVDIRYNCTEFRWDRR